MAGITRWRDLQNIVTTEDEINLLSGLTIGALIVNKLEGFTGTGLELNSSISGLSDYFSHKITDLSLAHPISANSIDGGSLVDATISKSKLNFIALTDSDKIDLLNSIGNISLNQTELATQVDALYQVLFPSQTGDIAEQFAQLVGHIEKVSDAHDASAISFGNQYFISSDCIPTATQSSVDLDKIRYLRVGDSVEFRDTNSGPEIRVITGINYSTGQFLWSSGLAQEYKTSNNATLKVISEANVQTALERSLKNNTDIFSGRLTIEQASSDDAFVVNKTGLGYTASFNDFKGKTFENFKLELGNSNNASSFQLLDSNKRIAFETTDQGETLGTNYSLVDRSTNNAGLITKQELSSPRSWTLPDRSGYIGLGDLTFTELLKVKLVSGSKTLTVAPGFYNDYEGQIVGAWISMEKSCLFSGATFNIQNKFSTDGQSVDLGNKWQVFTVYINTEDNVNFFYGSKEDTKELALSEYMNFIPSAFMKLAKIVVQGDGAGGILQSSIEIVEDQRPFLTMGMSASYYDETIVATNGYDSGALISLPVNSRAGGLIQTYKIGRGQLEIYLDGTYQTVNSDYEEFQGDPIGRIRILKNIPQNSVLHFRITYTAAAVTGGFDVPTLQSAYMSGALVSVAEVIGPITLTSFDTDLLLSVTGSIQVTNKIYDLKSVVFQPYSLDSDLDRTQLYTNENSELIFHQYKNNTATSYNLLQEIEDSKTVTRTLMVNAAGVVIPKGAAVALHPTLQNGIVLCNTSNSLSTARCIGVTTEIIGISATGPVAISGQIKNINLGLSHNKVLVVDPRNPGKIAHKDSVTFLPTDEYMEVGVQNGASIILNLVHIPMLKSVWKVCVAGESFSANETVAVRFANENENSGRVFKADKSNANISEKFWVIGVVNPSLSIQAGEAIAIYKEASLSSSESAFDIQDIGKPIYLSNNGEFKPWRLLNGSFTMGDAAIKIGMIEDTKKIIIDGIQMMGTAPGASFY